MLTYNGLMGYSISESSFLKATMGKKRRKKKNSAFLQMQEDDECSIG